MLLGKNTKGLLSRLGWVMAFPMIFLLQAQQSEANEQESIAQDKPVQTQPEPVTPDKATIVKTVKTQETFTPTEDISEDSSVSYPVDI